MFELDPGSPKDWLLKGQGNANAVFGYGGTDRPLVSPAKALEHTAQTLPWLETLCVLCG